MKLSDFKGLFHSDIITLKSSSNPFDDYWVFDFDTGTKNKPWEAGEHGIFSFQEKIGGRGFRPMSVASTFDEGIIRIGTRTGANPSPWKQKMMEMNPGDTMKIRGPFGPFKLQDTTSPVVMIAGGIGITPYRAIMRELESQTDRDIVLIYTAKQEHLFRADFEAIAQKNPKVKLHFISGRDETSSLIEQYVSAYGSDAYYYVSGTPDMIKSLSGSLKEQGISKKRILSDSFQGY